MEGPTNPERRKFLGVLAGASAAAAAGPQELTAQGVAANESLAMPEHPAIKTMREFVSALNRYFAERKEVNPHAIPEQEKMITQEVVKKFLESHAYAFGFVNAPPPPGFELWSIGKALGYSLRGGGDGRTSAFIESQLDVYAYAMAEPPKNGVVLPWNHGA